MIPLMQKNKNDVATIIIAGLGKKDEEGDKIDEAHLTAADDIIAAVEKKDSHALAEAFSHFVELCYTELETEFHEEYGEERTRDME